MIHILTVLSFFYLPKIPFHHIYKLTGKFQLCDLFPYFPLHTKVSNLISRHGKFCTTIYIKNCMKKVALVCHFWKQLRLFYGGIGLLCKKLAVFAQYIATKNISLLLNFNNRINFFILSGAIWYPCCHNTTRHFPVNCFYNSQNYADMSDRFE